MQRDVGDHILEVLNCRIKGRFKQNSFVSATSSSAMPLFTSVAIEHVGLAIHLLTFTFIYIPLNYKMIGKEASIIYRNIDIEEYCRQINRKWIENLRGFISHCINDMTIKLVSPLRSPRQMLITS